jgi:hypothetical protein
VPERNRKEAQPLNTLQTIFDWTPFVVALTTLLSIFVLAPLGVFRLTRSFAGSALIFASFVFGVILWVYGAIATFLYWGWLGLIIGVVIVGVGVVPTGFLALALQSQWEWLANLGLLLASMVGSRLLGLWYLAKADRDN